MLQIMGLTQAQCNYVKNGYNVDEDANIRRLQ